MTDFRFYENDLPKLDEIVAVKVLRFENDNVYVSLLEYQNIEALIISSEVSRRRIANIKSVINYNKIYFCVVISVDYDKKYIDLSKKKVNDIEAEICMKNYIKSKTVNSILMRVSELTNTDIEFLSKNISWYFYKKYQHAIEGFYNIKNENINVDELIKNILIEVCETKLEKKSFKIKAIFEITNFTSLGSKSIIDALNAGKVPNVSIYLNSSPTYTIFTETLDEKDGIDIINSCLDKIKEKIISDGGNFILKYLTEVNDDQPIDNHFNISEDEQSSE